MLDYAKVKINAGSGGRGIVSFRREKYVPKGGPDGGDGGRGGSVYIVASNDISTLLDFHYLNHMEAESGESGGPSNMKGKDGNDLFIKVPVGSIVKLNKLVVDIPHRKRRKTQQEEPISYTQKMFNYKKMYKLRMKEEQALQEAEEKDEQPIIDDEDLITLNEQLELDNQEQLANEVAVLEQTTSNNEEDIDAGIMRSDVSKTPPEGHKLYKFSEQERHYARPLRAQSSAATRYQKDEIPVFDLDKEGEMIQIARGGNGGRGNARFKWSQNQAPKFAEPAQHGEYVEIEIVLKMVANVGIIGYPNAGKSTLLSKLTAASPKIANYPFTTLEPNLGVTYIDEKPFVLADIPGLIEGASEGKGLGYRFLQHVERTKILLHVVEIPDLDQVGSPQEMIELILSGYTTIRNELMQYGNTLPDKLEIIVINKIDKIPEDQRKEYINPLEVELKKLKRPYVFISADQELGLNGLKKVIQDTLVVDAQ